MTGYYDYVLALIPSLLVGVTTVLSLFGVPLEAALFAGSGASSLVVGHAVFVRTPVAEAERESAGSTADVPARSEPASRPD